MIQTALFFILGFLSAAFLALLAAPSIWRRAVVLTRRRVEGALPLTMDEIQADKDRLRAEFAVSSRRLEIEIRALKEKIAAQMIREGRDREELARLSALGIDRDSDNAKAHAEIAELRARLAEQQDGEAALAAEIAAANDRIAAQAAEIGRLGRMYDEASFLSSSRQIEMVSLESRIDRLTEEAGGLRDERKDAQRKAREAGVESKSLGTALRDEHRKVVALENRVTELTASLADSEERLERRQQEVARLRSGEAAPGDGGDAVLRERIGELAAEMVHLTAVLEGAQSPIPKMLEQAAAGSADRPSLADRIRALRDAAAQKAG